MAGSHRRRRSRRRPRAFARALTAVLWAVVAALVWHSSYATFTASATNPTNSWATGTVVLSDDDSSTAMFNVAGLSSNSSGSKCIQVSYEGTVSASIRLFGTGFTHTGALGSYINLAVERGTGGSFGGGCSGFAAAPGAANTFSGTVASFASAHDMFASGFGTWVSNGASAGNPETQTYKITYTVDASIPNSAQGSTASIGLTWEARHSVANYLDAHTSALEGSRGLWTDWYNASSSVSSEHARSGTSSLRVNTADWAWGITVNNWPGYAATAGEHTISFWARGGAGTGMGVSMTVSWRDSSNNVLQEDTITISNLTTTWKSARAEVVAPAGTAAAWVVARHDTGAAGNHLYLDDIFVGKQG